MPGRTEGGETIPTWRPLAGAEPDAAVEGSPASALGARSLRGLAAFKFLCSPKRRDPTRIDRLPCALPEVRRGEWGSVRITRQRGMCAPSRSPLVTSARLATTSGAGSLPWSRIGKRRSGVDRQTPLGRASGSAPFPSTRTGKRPPQIAGSLRLNASDSPDSDRQTSPSYPRTGKRLLPAPPPLHPPLPLDADRRTPLRTADRQTPSSRASALGARSLRGLAAFKFLCSPKRRDPTRIDRLPCALPEVRRGEWGSVRITRQRGMCAPSRSPLVTSARLATTSGAGSLPWSRTGKRRSGVDRQTPPRIPNHSPSTSDRQTINGQTINGDPSSLAPRLPCPTIPTEPLTWTGKCS